ncbi:sialic acid-binding Ig-like lectin 6 [Gymnodraco acuticeps]|uniref:Sialic acid-binding Ig-like lectin 6 n=1 Tax=Gymnodraco acuticeps TaxID=8218 RepID=A0A6P8T0W5_GYMAC|nr:sialic acid-binding Ig-like lectin 6 [Gymnodraco acuticeps]
MFVLICATLLFSVRGIHAETGASVWGRPYCQGYFCITLGEADITAEAGLCVVIPCSFSTAAAFKTQHIVWYKCKLSNRKCGDPDMIFHTNKHNTKVQSVFKGRLSLLQPVLSQGNCSIIINDLTESDSGAYQLRVNGLLYENPDGLTYSERAVLSVKGLTQKPSVMIPPLTEGQPTTLTCTAPGLCSGSDPKFTWTWRGAGEKDSQITGNITALKTENLTAVTQSHSSTLTFNPSAEHHSSNVTCEVSFRNNITAEKTVTLNVTFYPKILNSSKCEVQSGVLTCVCISKGIPLPYIIWPLLNNHSEYSVITTVSHQTIHSTLTVKDHNNTVVECVGRSKVGEVQHTIPVITSQKREANQHEPSAQLPWVVVAAVSLFVNVISIILIMFLWHTRKKVKPNQEDRTYMSIKKTDVSSDYEVIAQPLN